MPCRIGGVLGALSAVAIAAGCANASAPSITATLPSGSGGGASSSRPASRGTAPGGASPSDGSTPASRPTTATVTIYGPDVDAPGALLPMVATVHGAADADDVTFAIDVAGNPGRCAGAPWRHATGRSQTCWVTLPGRPGTTQVTASARLSSAAGVAQTAPGRYGVRASGPTALAVSAEEQGRIERCGHSTDQVWLTFDDGFESDAALHAVVDELTRENVRGHFFAVGTWASANPRRVAEIRRQGHLIHNHSASHQWLNTLGDEPLRAEIAGGPAPDEPRLLRPGYGAGVFTDRVRDTAAGQGLGLCFWTVDPRDWAGPTADVILSRVMAGDEKTAPVAAGGVVLFHMTGAHTAEALPRVIAAIRAGGLTLEPLR